MIHCNNEKPRSEPDSVCGVGQSEEITRGDSQIKIMIIIMTEITKGTLK